MDAYFNKQEGTIHALITSQEMRESQGGIKSWQGIIEEGKKKISWPSYLKLLSRYKEATQDNKEDNNYAKKQADIMPNIQNIPSI